MSATVGFCNKKLFKEFLNYVAVISSITTIVSLVITIPEEYKLWIALGIFAILLFTYCYLWRKANNLQAISFHIGTTNIEIKFGDLFTEKGLKVIAFNEFFDTLVDDYVIAKTTLNGIFIKKYFADGNTFDLDNSILNNAKLEKHKQGEKTNRPLGKKIYYKLGTIHRYSDYLLTAFTRFDDDNKANLSTHDYFNFLFTFWNELDIIYAGQSVAIPLLGSGITRFNGKKFTEQELLEMLLLSFKINQVNFPHDATLTIILHDSLKSKINLYA